MENILMGQDFNYVSKNDKKFLIAFDKEMNDLGFVRTTIGDFSRWGNYTIAYIKPKVKAKTYIAKILFNKDSVLLRLYFRDIDKNKEYIENAPSYIKEAFINDEGNCDHCHNGGCVKVDGSCSHRKVYNIDGITYEKCDGKVFYFHNYDLDNLNDYINLIKNFHCIKVRK